MPEAYPAGPPLEPGFCDIAGATAIAISARCRFIAAMFSPSTPDFRVIARPGLRFGGYWATAIAVAETADREIFFFIDQRLRILPHPVKRALLVGYLVLRRRERKCSAIL
jgi:hypothetical protein